MENTWIHECKNWCYFLWHYYKQLSVLQKIHVFSYKIWHFVNIIGKMSFLSEIPLWPQASRYTRARFHDFEIINILAMTKCFSDSFKGWVMSLRWCHFLVYRSIWSFVLKMKLFENIMKNGAFAPGQVTFQSRCQRFFPSVTG